MIGEMVRQIVRDAFRYVEWKGTASIGAYPYVCGYCGLSVASTLGYIGKQGVDGVALIRICPHCNGPTAFAHEWQRFPDVPPGKPVSGLPDSVATLYSEAREAAGVGAYTAAVLVCRTLIMHIAVDKGADEGLQFAPYIQ